MKALVQHDVGEPPRYEDASEPEAGPGRAVVRVTAAALNHRDLFITQGLYPNLSFPVILGSDGCGVVERVVDGDRSWEGREVVIDPGLDWGEDIRVQSRSYRILGMPDDGTFAERIAVPIDNLHEKPAHLDAPHAAALPLAAITAWRALITRAGLERDEKVVVSGIGGGVATTAMQIAVATGAKVWVTSSRQEKIDRAVELGAEGGFLYTEAGWGRKARKEIGGADVIVDGAGGEGFAELVDALAMAGRIAVYGATRGTWPALLPPKLFFKQASILTTTMGSPMEFRDMIAFVGEHRLAPIIDRAFPLSEGAEAFAHLSSGSQQGKVVLTP